MILHLLHFCNCFSQSGLIECHKTSVYLLSLISPFFSCTCSNASDALDKLRYLSVSDPDLLKDGPELDIRIQTDKDNGIITIM